jgi:hypothetical protein
MMPNRRGPLDANSLKHQPSRVLPALALNKPTRRTGTGALHEVREIIIALLREPDQTMCVECVATALGQQVGVVMMTMLGLPDPVASFQGVCSTCHRYARVIRRAAPEST